MKRQSKAKIQQYDALQAKVKMMEGSKGEGDAALDLLKQFVSTGFVTQDEDGNFKMPGVSGERTFPNEHHHGLTYLFKLP